MWYLSPPRGDNSDSIRITKAPLLEHKNKWVDVDKTHNKKVGSSLWAVARLVRSHLHSIPRVAATVRGSIALVQRVERLPSLNIFPLRIFSYLEIFRGFNWWKGVDWSMTTDVALLDGVYCALLQYHLTMNTYSSQFIDTNIIFFNYRNTIWVQ